MSASPFRAAASRRSPTSGVATCAERQDQGRGLHKKAHGLATRTRLAVPHFNLGGVEPGGPGPALDLRRKPGARKVLLLAAIREHRQASGRRHTSSTVTRAVLGTHSPATSQLEPTERKAMSEARTSPPQYARRRRAPRRCGEVQQYVAAWTGGVRDGPYVRTRTDTV